MDSANWPFDQTPNTAAITTRQVLDQNLPVLVVVHYSDDHDWAFLCGTTDDEQDGRVVRMDTMLNIDPSLYSIAHLKPGMKAWRSEVGSAWSIEPFSR